MEENFENKSNQPTLDYTIYVTSELITVERTKQILAIEKIGITFSGDGKSTITVRGQEYVINQLKEFDWVTSIKLYNCYLRIVHH